MLQSSTVIPARDGYPLEADWWPGREDRGAPVVVIAGALGVGRRYYRAFASHLAAHGMAVVTFDYRGIGGSAPRRLRGFGARARDWGQLDLAGVLGWLGARRDPATITVVGHSIGGQLLGMVPPATRFGRALLVAAQAGSWHHWSGLGRVALLGLWYAALPALTATAGMLPMRWFGLGDNVPAGVAREWAAWARCPDYLFDPRHGLDLRGFSRLDVPLRAYSFADDFYAPLPAVQALLARYPAAAIEHRHLTKLPRPVGHFGFFREGVVPELWREAVAWLGASEDKQRESFVP
jgi:predicted alpha/beta hydrolase